MVSSFPNHDSKSQELQVRAHLNRQSCLLHSCVYGSLSTKHLLHIMLYFGVFILLLKGNRFPKFSVTINTRAKSLLRADMHTQLQKHLVQLLSELQKEMEALCSVLQRHLLAFTRLRV